MLSGGLSGYTVTLLSGSSVRLVDKRSGGDGTDTVLNVEHFRFADGTLDFGQLRNRPVVPVSVRSVSINDVTVTEGHNSTKVATFSMTCSGGSGAFHVNVATADGSATDAGQAGGTLPSAASHRRPANG